MRRAQASSAWDPFEVEELRGKTLGVIGYGGQGVQLVGGGQSGMDVIVLVMDTAWDYPGVLVTGECLLFLKVWPQFVYISVAPCSLVLSKP